MGINLLIESLEKLLKLHKSLLELALKKTGVLEAEDIQALTQLLKEEQAHILAIEKIEAERSKAVAAFSSTKRTLGELLDELPPEKQEIVIRISEELRNVIARIQKQNELNQGLISQSLKFISFSRSLVEPPQDDYNYGPNETGIPGKSLFSSKA
ncbi:flagellar protein FlgN [Mesobacillus boroniphilus]|uniref:Flagellar protein FlgN n=1 Tax=Mesobacillus boroniphilus TaxID=308892 RepID=A0A944CNE7_9BACI|nr:flagellar protein FlgN [Mesobacillus boroniphilus]MBS8265775.1 flagellar protein FlgN [Mesobacillus boroniphilus]